MDEELVIYSEGSFGDQYLPTSIAQLWSTETAIIIIKNPVDEFLNRRY